MVLLSVESIRGHRDYMEDRYAYIEKAGILIAMVCDGHGGYQVAEDTSKELPQRLLKTLKKDWKTNVATAMAIRNVIIEWGLEMKHRQSGSTLTGIAVKDSTMYVYNIGDSRTCFRSKGSHIYQLLPVFDRNGKYNSGLQIEYSFKQFFCTKDHNSMDSREVARVVSAGGQIIRKRLNGTLSVTRALGDSDVGPGLDHIPDVYWLKKSAVLGSIVMFSDGIYEPFVEDNCNEIIKSVAEKYGAEVLVKYAYCKRSEDNLTAMVVSLK
jgi:serine/threonine protein phosphatase PrpC